MVELSLHGMPTLSGIAVYCRSCAVLGLWQRLPPALPLLPEGVARHSHVQMRTPLYQSCTLCTVQLARDVQELR